MRILQLCPLWYPVSLDAPGGIEVFLAHLIRQLRVLGCEVSCLAVGANPSGTVPAVIDTGVALRTAAGIASEYVYYEQHQLHLALSSARQFDVIHSHIGPGGFVLSAVEDLTNRVLHTAHTPIYSDLQWFIGQHPDFWISTVSEYQAALLREVGATRCHVIHNAIDVATFEFTDSPQRLLAYLGRMEAAKGADIAIAVARDLGWPLVLAGPIVEKDFFERRVAPELNERIRYVGILAHQAKNALLGSAACVLMPSRAAEPFGLVAIEAMATGTPVVALANGALPEIIEEGLTGYLSTAETRLAALVHRAVELDRRAVRTRAEQRFDISVAARAYLDLYREVVASTGHARRN